LSFFDIESRTQSGYVTIVALEKLAASSSSSTADIDKESSQCKAVGALWILKNQQQKRPPPAIQGLYSVSAKKETEVFVLQYLVQNSSDSDEICNTVTWMNLLQNHINVFHLS